MQNPSQIVTKSLILDEICDFLPNCTEDSLKIHISNLRKKLSFFIGGIFMNAKETLELISKQWCTTEDLMKLANVSRPTAMKYKKRNC